MNNIRPVKQEKSSFKSPVRFTLAADQGWGQRLNLAYKDIYSAVKLYKLIWVLAFSEIKLRYKVSAISPFRLTMSTAVQIGAMALVYADLFHTNIMVYLPLLCVSMIIWNYLNSLVNDRRTCFIGSEALIKGSRMPFMVHAARSVLRDTIVFGHNLIVLVAVLILMRVHQSFSSLLVIPGLFLWFLGGLAIALTLGTICARFPDVTRVVSSVIQVVFLATPAMWSTDILKGHKKAELLIHLDPFVYLLDIVRSPLLGQP